MGSTGVLLRRRDSFKPFLEAEWNRPNILTVMHWGPSILTACISLPAAADCQVWCGAEMPTVGTGSFVEPRPTPQLLFFMCGERLSAGDRAQSLSIMVFASTYLPAGCHNGRMLFYLQVIKQL